MVAGSASDGAFNQLDDGGVIPNQKMVGGDVKGESELWEDTLEQPAGFVGVKA